MRFPRVFTIVLLFFALPGSAGEVSFAPAEVEKALCEVLVDGHLACSGFFIDKRGVCLTCAHAIVGEKQLELLLSDGRRVAATRGGVNVGADAAILFGALPQGETVRALSFAAKPPSVGTTVFLAGMPLYRHGLFLKGSVARRHTSFEYNPTLKTYVEVFYVTAMTPRGTSGGPWLTGAGQVVGNQLGSVSGSPGVDSPQQ